MPNSKDFDIVRNADYNNGALELQPKEKITLRYPFTVPFKGDIELRLCRSRSGSPLATTTLTIDKEPHYYDIAMTDYKVVYKADEKDMTKAVTCTLSFKNNDKRPLSCEIYSRIGNDGRENGEYTTVTPEGTTTVISTIDAPDADAPFYDLQGRRVSHPHKGIYIRNGKKVRR